MNRFVNKPMWLGGITILCLLLFVLLSMQSQARRGGQVNSPPLSNMVQTDHFPTRYIRHGLDVNDFRIPMTNWAVFGQFIELGAAGGEWPKGSNEFYIYGAGLWVGGNVNNPSLQTLAFSNVGTKRDSDRI